jgi:hypothetical protein
MRADWAVVLAAWALLLAATTLPTGATLYADAVALGSVRTSVRNVAPGDRSAIVSYATRAPDAAAIGPTVRRELDQLVGAGGGGDVWQLASLGPFGFAGDDPATAKQASFTTIGPVVVPEPDLLAAAGQSRISFEWRAIPDVDRLTAESIGPLGDAAAALPTDLHAVLPAGLATTVAPSS